MSNQRKVKQFRQRRVHPTMGMQIRVCGASVDKDNDLVCMLPFNHTSKHPTDPTVVHVAIGINIDNVVVIVYRQGKENPVWQAVESAE